MTIQATDYIHIDNKKCLLIDVEESKQIIDYIDFEIPEHSEAEIPFSPLVILIICAKNSIIASMIYLERKNNK